MKIFFDTCAIVDYLCNRKEAQLVDEILSNAEAKEWECFISVGSFYTLTYLLELHLKRNGFSDKEQRIGKLREILEGILDTFAIADIYVVNKGFFIYGFGRLLSVSCRHCRFV